MKKWKKQGHFYMGNYTLSSNMGLLYSKWSHRSHKLNQKEKNWKQIKGGRDIKENTSKIPQNSQKVKFGQFLLNFSAPLHFFHFFSFWLTLYDLCGHFECNKPIFYDNFALVPTLLTEMLKMLYGSAYNVISKHCISDFPLC